MTARRRQPRTPSRSRPSGPWAGGGRRSNGLEAAETSPGVSVRAGPRGRSPARGERRAACLAWVSACRLRPPTPRRCWSNPRAASSRGPHPQLRVQLCGGTLSPSCFWGTGMPVRWSLGPLARPFSVWRSCLVERPVDAGVTWCGAVTETFGVDWGGLGLPKMHAE